MLRVSTEIGANESAQDGPSGPVQVNATPAETKRASTGGRVSARKWSKCLAVSVVLLLRLGLLLLLLLRAPTRTGALDQVPNRHTVASIPGELVIGLLVPVHERPSPKQAQTRTCGTVREQYGIQRVEAAFRTIDAINADQSILPNITLGIEIRDSCWHSPIALEQSIEFIRDAMAASEQTQSRPGQPLGAAATSAQPAAAEPASAASSVCGPLLLRQQQLGQAKRVKNIVGVVGPASSTDTVQVQNLLQLFNMSQVGYSATSRDLSNKNHFQYFLRVVPSDILQAQVMIDLMLAHNWTYITVAYTEGRYGSSLMNAFRERAQEVGICFATLESMPPDADDAKFDELIEAIQKHPNARVVICMCEGRSVGKLFSGFKRKNVANEYLVVGSDGWSDRFDVVQEREEYALGGISIRIHSAYVYDFDDYYFALNPFTNYRNPWFAEFWETRFQCNLELAGQQRPFVRPPGAKVHNRTCTGRESLRNNHKQDAKMAFVQKSIITMALGLDSMQRAVCAAGRPGLCPDMLPVNGSLLLQHLMNVSFSFLDEEVYFDEHGDPPGKYEILNFQRRRKPPGEPPPPQQEYSPAPDEGERRRLNPLYDSYSTLRVYRPRAKRAPTGLVQAGVPGGEPHPPASGYSSASGYEYVQVGSWKSSDGLSLYGDIRWPAGASRSQSDPLQLGAGGESGAPPKSLCSLPCAKGHAKKIQSDSVKCCWVCVPCRPDEYLFNEFKCRACEKGWWPNAVQTGCEQIPIQYLDWRSMEALSAISIALIGLLLTLMTAVVFVRHNNTPVVKSSTRELSYMILFAMLLCYANTFFLVAKPRRETCFVTRVLPGFAFAMMYGALVTKTNRIARILAGSKKKIITRRPRFMSAMSQVAITWLIVLVECLIIVGMLLREPADRMLDYPAEERVVLVCNTTTMGIIAPLGFDFFLIAMCTLYAFKTRNVPENFNEAKFIGFTMYTTLVIWVAFVAIYLSSDHKVTTLCLCISFSALFALFLLFFPRCYIIIFKPEKNNRSFFTTTKNVRCHIGYQLGHANQHQQQQQQNSNNTTSTTATNYNQCLSAADSLDLDQAEPAELAARWQARMGLVSGLQRGQAFAEPPGRTSSSSSPATLAAHRGGLQPLSPPANDSVFEQPALARSLLGSLFTIFARRSRKRKSDKASSIQQHLRAVRHAENLDRQTHFRRSQVQRLAQRFECSSGGLQPERATASLRSFELTVARNEDGERLLAALRQLIGAQNVWRLAELLRRFCLAREASLYARTELLLGVERRPVLLDLDRLADRKLALKLLEFLAEMTSESIVELRSRAPLRPAVSVEEPQVGGPASDVKRSLSSEPGAVVVCKSSFRSGPPTVAERGRQADTQAAADNINYNNNLSFCNREEAAHAASDKPPQQQSRPQARPKDERTQQTDDPIKRALDCILGANQRHLQRRPDVPHAPFNGSLANAPVCERHRGRQSAGIELAGAGQDHVGRRLDCCNGLCHSEPSNSLMVSQRVPKVMQRPTAADSKAGAPNKNGNEDMNHHGGRSDIETETMTSGRPASRIGTANEPIGRANDGQVSNAHRSLISYVSDSNNERLSARAARSANFIRDADHPGSGLDRPVEQPAPTCQQQQIRRPQHRHCCRRAAHRDSEIARARQKELGISLPVQSGEQAGAAPGRRRRREPSCGRRSRGRTRDCLEREPASSDVDRQRSCSRGCSLCKGCSQRPRSLRHSLSELDDVKL